MREGPFKNIWIQPAAGDAGGALGAALYIWHRYLDRPRIADNIHDSQKGSYLGPAYSSEEIASFLETKNIPYEECSDEVLARRVAELIDQQNVIGLFLHRMEFGPRALGARSIVGDARSEEMQSKMNLKIKFRESFRPFAPSVLRERIGEFFEQEEESPYMLLVANVRQERILSESRNSTAKGLDKLKVKRSAIPAVTHVDYSARLQTVSEESHPVYYKIIKEFYRLTGCPAIINTSFNIRGEPIVCTPQDAYRCFMRTDMDYLVLGNFILAKRQQPVSNLQKKEEYSLILD